MKMKHLNSITITLIFVTLVLSLPMNSYALTPRYQFLDLGTLGGKSSCAIGINDLGQVVGTSATSTDNYLHTNPFLWDEANGMLDLGIPSSYLKVCEETRINNLGEVGGHCGDGGDNWHIILWKNGNITDLGTFGGRFAYFIDHNDQGQVIGYSDNYKSFVWDAIQGKMDIGNLGGYPSVPIAINNKGEIVGNSRTTNGEDHAWILKDGIMIDIGTLGGSYSYAKAINDGGQVFGQSMNENEELRLFLWDKAIGIRDIGPLPAGMEYRAGINNRGQVVGTFWEEGQTPVSFYWDSVNGLKNLTDLILDSSKIILYGVNDINNDGQIAAYANVDPNGDGIFDETHAIMLKPISVTISIDIKPKSEENKINIIKGESISIAILSSNDFDAVKEVDWTSLTFGSTGDEQSLISCQIHKPKDITGDGLKDLVCRFSIKDASFKCGDTEGILKGTTVTGTLFEGSQNVLIAPCK